MVFITLESLAAKAKEPKVAPALAAYFGRGPPAPAHNHDPMDVDHLYQYPDPSFQFTQLDISTSPHNRPLYLTGELNGVTFTRCLVDISSEINIMPYSTYLRTELEGMQINRQASGSNSVGTIMVELQVGPIISNTIFYVMHHGTASHLILGREWVHRHHGVASTMHQCFRGMYHDRPVVIRASPNPFASHELHLPEAQPFL